MAEGISFGERWDTTMGTLTAAEAAGNPVGIVDSTEALEGMAMANPDAYMDMLRTRTQGRVALNELVS